MEASRYVLSRYDTTEPITTIKEKTINAISEALDYYGNNAQITANKMFDYILAGQGTDYIAEWYSDLIDMDFVVNKVKYLLKDIAAGNYDKYNQRIRDYTESLIHRTANASQKRNAKNYGIRFALVPQSKEPCGFCYMLASRGFKYSLSTKIKYKNSIHGLGHEHCKCLLLPSNDKDLKVYGYDEEKLKDYYNQARETAGSRAEDIAKELERMGEEIG